MTYAASGVDIDAGDDAARRIVAHMQRTHGPRVIRNPGGFAGLFRLDYNERLFKRNYRDPVLVACTDGVGTKVKLAIEMGVHDTVGRDCVAMSINDLIVQGAEPLFFLDYIGTHAVDPVQVEAIVKGVADGCAEADCALLGGETAEMPDLYAAGEYDLAGFAVGVVELKRAVDPVRVQAGDVVIALASDGVHSNGYSLVRAIVRRKRLRLDRAYPDMDPHDHASGRTLGEALLTPTRIYARPIVRLGRAYRVKKVISGMAHITGGGLAGNLSRALNSRVDAVIDWKAWETPPIFSFLARAGGVKQQEMRRVFNMGVGYVLIVRPAFADSIVRRLTRLGERAFIIGEIVRGAGSVREK